MSTEILTVIGIGGAVTTGAVICTVGWGIGVYNTIQTAQQDIKGQWSNVKTEYQRRADMLFNLAASVKGSAKFEKDTYVGVALGRSGRAKEDLMLFANARKGKFGKDMQSEMRNLNQLNTLMMNIMGRMEQYPQVKSTVQFQELMAAVETTEDRINLARTEYNKMVEDYNTYIRVFPNNLIAGRFGAKDEVFFELDNDESKVAPKLDVMIE